MVGVATVIPSFLKRVGGEGGVANAFVPKESEWAWPSLSQTEKQSHLKRKGGVANAFFPKESGWGWLAVFDKRVMANPTHPL